MRRKGRQQNWKKKNKKLLGSNQYHEWADEVNNNSS